MVWAIAAQYPQCGFHFTSSRWPPPGWISVLGRSARSTPSTAAIHRTHDHRHLGYQLDLWFVPTI